jgi:mRNA interferase MazF
VLFQRRTGFILLDQLRTLDKSRLIQRLGAVSGETLTITLATLREIFEE